MRTTGIEFPAAGQMAFCELGEPPAPGPGQALLRTLFSGVTNGTERHGMMGEHGWDQFPRRDGYQHVCEVIAVGDDTVPLRPGDRVFYGDYVGHRGWHIASVPGLMVRIPPQGDASRYALMGVAGVALRACRRLRVSAGQRVLSVGVGPIGIFGAQCARAMGARVTVAEVVALRLAAARATGAHAVVDMAKPEAWNQVAAGGPYDVILDGAGYDRFFFDIFERGLVGHGCAIGAIAVRSETAFPWAMLHTTEAAIEVSCHFGVSELECLAHLIDSGAVQVEPVISHRVSIDEAPGIYTTMRDHPRELYGVIFDWS